MSAATLHTRRADPGRGARAGSGSDTAGPLERAAILLVPALLGLGLCLIGLNARGLGFDEGATVAIASQHGHALWRGIDHDGGNMSGYYLLIHVLIGAFGEGPWVLRLPSVIAAGLTPALVAAIALALWEERRVAWIAGILSAVSVPLVYWGQTTRGYAAMLCLACLGMWCFARWVRGAERDARALPWLAGWVVASALAAYCGFIVALIVLPQLIWIAVRSRALALRFVLGILVLVVVCLPLLVLAHERGSGQLFWVARPNAQTDAYVLQELTGAGFQSTFHRAWLTTPGWIVLSCALLGILAWALRERVGGAGMGLALLWAFLPGLAEFLGSFVVQPVFLPRNVLLSVPAVALVLAAALADRRLPRWLAVAGLGLVLLIRAVPLAEGYAAAPEPWRQVTAHVLARTRPGDCVSFYPEDARNAFRYYVARDDAIARAPRSIQPDIGWRVTRPYVELYPTISPHRIMLLRRTCRRMWLVSSHEGQPQGPPLSRVHLRRFERLQRRLRHAFGRPRLSQYGWASTIHVALFSPRGG